MTKNRIALALAAPFAAAVLALAGPAHAAETELKLEKVEIDLADLPRLQSGARTFVNYCLGCHGAELVRYNTLVQLGLTEQQVKDNLMFTAEKIGGYMRTAMRPADGKEWFGVAPPDLSVIARARGADWLYTYLRGFYRDPSTVTGWNNTVFPTVAMPNVFEHLQGDRVRKEEPVMRDGKEVGDGHGGVLTRVTFETIRPGSQTPVEFDRTVRDLVNFLVWMGEPVQDQRKQIGFFALLAIGVLIVLSYLLYKEYWKDVH
ncbi:MAG: cytochrome c1 [Burkholderiales bacterium]|nr:cytochrome c1 [Burkholderiales bacterium]